ncbi:uncharacterized protein LOC114518932 [Dendronephthya gigantea]|uniref:uncharacterized protein LOC114518932 n=1 Tax=Dendronephthya gigantea TaxID=151771 RepID=UPI00106CBEF8|nr:uncharacterized protein LOC114518932 [Dendronephthya gigantea]
MQTLSYSVFFHGYSFPRYMSRSVPVECDRMKQNDLEQCNEENFGRRKLVKEKDGKEWFFICFKHNGNYTWKKELDNENEVMDDILLKQEAASEFFKRGRRSVYEECYSECCRYEEVCENFKSNKKAAMKYWTNFRKWVEKNNYCRRKSGWSW